MKKVYVEKIVSPPFRFLSQREMNNNFVKFEKYSNIHI